MKGFLWLFLICVLSPYQQTQASDFDCQPHAKRNISRLLSNLRDIENQENQGDPLSLDELLDHPRAKNFPYLAYQQVKWCRSMEVYNFALQTVHQMGFLFFGIDQMYKRYMDWDENSALSVRSYTIGPTRSRERVDKEFIQNNPNLNNIIYSFGSGIFNTEGKKVYASTVVLGRFLWQQKEEWIVSLPFHAMTDNPHTKQLNRNCEDFHFYLNGVQTPLTHATTLQHLPDADLSLCLLSIEHLDEGFEKLQILPMAFDKTYPKGERLMTLGRGLWENPDFSITIDRSAECQSLSASSQTMAYSPAPLILQKVIPIGCDTSKGDSGSGVYTIDGSFVGFVSSTPQYTFESHALDIFEDSLDEKTQLKESTRMIPVNEVRRAIQRTLKKDLDSKTKAALKSLIDSQ